MHSSQWLSRKKHGNVNFFQTFYLLKNFPPFWIRDYPQPSYVSILMPEYFLNHNALNINALRA